MIKRLWNYLISSRADNSSILDADFLPAPKTAVVGKKKPNGQKLPYEYMFKEADEIAHSIYLNITKYKRVSIELPQCGRMRMLIEYSLGSKYNVRYSIHYTLRGVVLKYPHEVKVVK